MIKIYKLSKFNYFVEDNNNLLIYNAFKGSDSFLKLVGNVKEQFLYAWKCGATIDEQQFDSVTVNTFLQKGVIVPLCEDEQAKLSYLYLRTVHTGYLKLIILPNEKCNFRCQYCYENLPKQEMKSTTIESILEFVHKKIRFFQGLNVTWYGGEPLLSLNTIIDMSSRFIELCKKNKKVYLADITTNGFLFDTSTFQTLRKLHVFSYQITIDGDEKTHNIQRPLHNGKGTYHTIMNNLKDIHTKAQGRFQIIIRTNYSQILANHLNLFIDDLRQILQGDDRFQLLLRPVMDWGGQSIESFRENLVDVGILDKVYEILSQTDLPLSLSYYKSLLNPGGAMCYAGQMDTYTINSSGLIFKCTCDINNQQDSSIGEIVNRRFEIDRYKEMKWISDIRSRHKDCTDCFFSPVCLYDFCPGRRNFSKGYSLSCPFEKYALSGLLKLMDKKEPFPTVEEEKLCR